MKKVCFCVAGALLTVASGVNASSVTVMALGDSITAGYNGVVADPGYRQTLLNDVNAQGKQFEYVGSYDPTLVTGLGYNAAGYSTQMTAMGQNFCEGFSGYTSLSILQNLDGDVVPPNSYVYGVLPNMGGYWLTGGGGSGHSAIYPDVVLLMAGTNDSGFLQLGNPSTPDSSEGAIAGLLQWFAVNRPSTTVILACPPLTVASASANTRITALESWEPGFVAANYPQDKWVDMAPIVPGSDISNDGVHPTDQGYSAIASVWDTVLAPLVPTVGTYTNSGAALRFSQGISIAGSAGSWTTKVDLSDNDAIVTSGNLGTITNQIASGYSGGTWKGNGITSSAAAQDPSDLTALGVMQNVNASGTVIYATFGGQASTVADVLVKYTYYGDANLDGKVDGSDFSMIDNGYASRSTAHPLSGWSNGDFNYDGVIDGSDYTLIDNAYNNQGARLSASVSTQIAPVPEPGAVGVLAIGLAALRRRRKS